MLRLETTPPLLWNLHPLAKEKRMTASTSRLSMARTLSKAFRVRVHLWEAFPRRPSAIPTLLFEEEYGISIVWNLESYLLRY